MFVQHCYDPRLKLGSILSDPIIWIEIRKRIVGSDNAYNDGNIEDEWGKKISREEYV